VLAYITLGGLSGAIYNEVLQFAVIIAGLVPLVMSGCTTSAGGAAYRARSVTPSWAPPPSPPGAASGSGTGRTPLGDWIGIVFGLGFVLSFGYWTTNFAEVSGPCRPRTTAAQRTPLIGAYRDLHSRPDHHPRPDRAGRHPNLGAQGCTHNDAIPLLMGRFLPNGALGIALAGLLAAFAGRHGGNVSSFNTVFT
jgi:SSS family solute:Na+ symporter